MSARVFPVRKETVRMAARIGQQLGNYRLLRKIGEGAFAEVYLGEHLYLERPAAIKVLHVQLGPQTQEQFRREARTIAHLQHPHIVQVLDFGIHDQTPYLVMEYTPGGTLQSKHPKGTRLSLEQIVTYVNQIASALDYAHQQHVIHRDIKPDNLLLNARHEILLSDFGLAVVQRTLDPLSTQNPAGTPLYMAPEQIQRHPCAASDQYALGILVYDWLCGEPPFRGTLYEVFSHHLYQPPPSLRERLPDLPVAVEEVVFKALAKDPAYRFACVTDFASALEQTHRATQPLSLPGRPMQQTHEPTVSQNAVYAPAFPTGEQTDSSFSTQPLLITGQQTEPGQEGASLSTPGPIIHPQSVSEVTKPAVAQSNRQRFLRRVRAFWIDGVLEHSLHGAALIALGLQEQRDALANPWHLVLHHPASPPRSFPPGTRITEVYDTANGELLILGAPGSGKTTLLLELARDLLDRAEHDEQHLLPVVFPLSSWTVKQKSLTDWLIEELINKYQVPRKLARTWVETKQLLPLLDGLDEVAPESRTACIDAINTYRQEHGLLPLVVSSRSADYLAQTARVRLGSAVAVQPLTQQQVENYLASNGEALWTLRVALQQDAALRELTETPLMLSILTLTYHDMPIEDLLGDGVSPTRQQVFEHYVERMLQPRGSNKARYRPEQTVNWLAWLARQLVKHNQTVFYIERLQPDWLPEGRSRGLYQSIAVKLLYGLIGGLISGLIYGESGSPDDWLAGLSIGVLLGILLSGRQTEIQWMKTVGWSWANVGRRFMKVVFDHLRNALLCGLAGGLVGALAFGLVFGLVYAVFPRPSPYGDVPFWLAGLLIVGLTSGVIGGLFGELVYWVITRPLKSLVSARQREIQFLKDRNWSWTSLGRRFMQAESLRNGLLGALLSILLFALAGFYSVTAALFYAVIGVLAGVLVGTLLSGKQAEIQPAERIDWSWGGIRRSLMKLDHVRNGLLCGLAYWLTDGLSGGYGSWGFSMLKGMVLGVLLSWLTYGITKGLSSRMLDKVALIKPNQGIWRSAQNSVVVGAISGLIGGVILGSETGLVVQLIWGRDGLAYALIYGIVSGLLIAVVSGLYNGGRACIQHIILRVLLWQTKCIPWNYPRFLDYAAEQILLRKVGGGYIFVHRLLLDYFTTLEALPVSHEPIGKREEIVPPVEAPLAPTGPTAVDRPLEPPPPVLPESGRLLPCGHEQRLAASFCSVCGARVAS